VTVVIPTYRRPATVCRAIECALDQRGVRVEVVVVDDCSGDGTPEFVTERYGSLIRVLEQPTNGGVSRARNRGLRHANGSFVSFLDDDDVWAPTKLQSQAEALQRKGSEWACSAVVVCDEELRPIRVDRVAVPASFQRLALERYPVPAAVSNILIDTAVAQSLGGFDAQYLHNADWDLVIRLALRGDPAVVDSPEIGYVLHRANVSGRPDGKYEDMHRLDTTYAEHRSALGAQSSRLDSLRWIGMSSARFSQRRTALSAYAHAFGLSRSRYDLVRALASIVPRYGELMDRRQARRLRRSADAHELDWLKSIGSARSSDDFVAGTEIFV
jgi:glycosyltransferase involved in cell wall biosynthesis